MSSQIGGVLRPCEKEKKGSGDHSSRLRVSSFIASLAERRKNSDQVFCKVNWNFLITGPNITVEAPTLSLRQTKPRDMKHYEREYMKIVMLKQEEMFRHQVHELHRLYKIQKLLMTDLKNAEMRRQRYPTKDTDLWNVKIETSSNNQCHVLDADEESDLELRLFTGGSRAQSKTKDTAFSSDSGSNLSSSSNEFVVKKQVKTEWSLLQLSDISARSRGDRKIGFDIEEQMMKDGLKQQPQQPWLSQCSKNEMIVSFGL